MHPPFEPFSKIPRYKSALVITEKIDGTNGQITITKCSGLVVDPMHDPTNLSPFCIDKWYDRSDDACFHMYVGSRRRWVAPEGTVGLEKGCDNYAFAHWAKVNHQQLRSLGEGQHFGEWYGAGIGRGYGMTDKKFKLFNSARWNDLNPNRPKCCGVVDVLPFTDPNEAMESLFENGSEITNDFGNRFPNPEGIIVYHPGSRSYFKQTFEYDKGKWSK